MDLVFYALVASPFALAAGLAAVYLLAEHIGREIPRWGDE